MIKGGEQLIRLSEGDRRMPPAPIKSAVEYVRSGLKTKIPELALILGSGFQSVLDRFEIEAELEVEGIPGFPKLGVAGHAGRLLVAEVEGMRWMVMSGRAHYYEGHSMEAVMFPVRLLAACGVSELLLTNAAGGINSAYQPGDFMIFKDHINCMGVNPLRGLPVEDGRCFVDLSDTYSGEWRAMLRTAGGEEGVTVHEGVYVGVSGPSYETPAEIRAFRMMGADAVGMSTIPEVLMARYCNMKVAAISCITNCAAGLSAGKLSHREVLETGRSNAANAARLFRRVALNRRTVAEA